MTWIFKSITGLGLLVLAHACYSAYEHSLLTTSSPLSSHLTVAISAPTSSELPTDIALETYVAILTVVLGLVLNTPRLKPIQWRVWAGQIEREGPRAFLDAEGRVEKTYVGNPFGALENRTGFLDIRRARREFADWVREGDSVGSGKG